jgi:DNA topoisomerase-1
MGRTPAHEGLEPPKVERSARSGGAKARRKSHGRLVIVESPAKARTVGRFLGKGYRVMASIGHVRDLLKSRLSVDVDNGFEPEYRVPKEKREVVKALKSEVARSSEVYLATDPDREGEAIAWHLLEAAAIEPDQARRVVFHEITELAVQEAFDHPRTIDMNLVDAQQARRILDRLVGYNLSPILWAKVRSRLSAGRVQSAALRLVVDREREIEAFQAREYWTIDVEFLQPDKPPAFRARLQRIDGSTPELPDLQHVQPVLEDLTKARFEVSSARRGSRQRRPLAPFTTSTLQQEAARRLGFVARKTMAVAQQLYEGAELGGGETVGLITYMRTDSTQVSAVAQQEARAFLQERFGPASVPSEPPIYRTRSRGAQEAHEAIRPTSVRRTPDDLAKDLTPEQSRLYRLIWERFLASQMEPADYETLTIEVSGTTEAHAYLLRVSASRLRSAGFLEVYEDIPTENGEGNGEGLEAGLAQLPPVEEGDDLRQEGSFPEQHFTQPPPRFSEASLVKALEDFGIGRPSTYAPILSTLQGRGYVHRVKKRLVPTEIGITVNDMIVDSSRRSSIWASRRAWKRNWTKSPTARGRGRKSFASSTARSPSKSSVPMSSSPRCGLSPKSSIACVRNRVILWSSVTGATASSSAAPTSPNVAIPSRGSSGSGCAVRSTEAIWSSGERGGGGSSTAAPTTRPANSPPGSGRCRSRARIAAAC